VTGGPGRPGSEKASAVFVQLAYVLDPRHDMLDTMDLLVHSAVRFTAAVDAGIVLADADAVLHMIASTSERTSDVEEIQLEAQQGPGWDSYRSGQTVEALNLRAARERWPQFMRFAEQRGFRAGYAVPVTLRGQHLGALNLFLDRSAASTDSDAAVAQALAQAATIAIVQRRVGKQRADRFTLQDALHSRILLEQAKGALAYRRGVSIDEAFKLLRDHARRTGARLRDVADQVVTLRASI